VYGCDELHEQVDEPSLDGVRGKMATLVEEYVALRNKLRL
jgi:hypothetical protein